MQPRGTRAPSFRRHVGGATAYPTGGLSEVSDVQLPAPNTSSALQGNSEGGDAGLSDQLLGVSAHFSAQRD